MILCKQILVQKSLKLTQCPLAFRFEGGSGGGRYIAVNSSKVLILKIKLLKTILGPT